MEELEKELDLPSTQILGLFNRGIRKVTQVKEFVGKNDVLADVQKTFIYKGQMVIITSSTVSCMRLMYVQIGVARN